MQRPARSFVSLVSFLRGPLASVKQQGTWFGLEPGRGGGGEGCREKND